MHNSDHELRVDEMPNQFSERIERNVIIISWHGLENECLQQNWKNRDDYTVLINDHLFI